MFGPWRNWLILFPKNHNFFLCPASESTVNHFLPPKSQRFSLLVGYNIQPSGSSTNQNAAFIVDHQLDFTNQPFWSEMGLWFVNSSPQVSTFSVFIKARYATCFIVWNFKLETLYSFVSQLIKAHKHCLQHWSDLGD